MKYKVVAAGSPHYPGPLVRIVSFSRKRELMVVISAAADGWCLRACGRVRTVRPDRETKKALTLGKGT